MSEGQLLSSCSVPAPRRGGFSFCGAQAPVVATCGLSSRGARALELRLSSRGARALELRLGSHGARALELRLGSCGTRALELRLAVVAPGL